MFSVELSILKAIISHLLINNFEHIIQYILGVALTKRVQYVNDKYMQIASVLLSPFIDMSCMIMPYGERKYP